MLLLFLTIFMNIVKFIDMKLTSLTPRHRQEGFISNIFALKFQNGHSDFGKNRKKTFSIKRTCITACPPPPPPLIVKTSDRSGIELSNFVQHLSKNYSFSNETVSDDPLRSPLWILVVNIVAMEMLRSKLPPGMYINPNTKLLVCACVQSRAVARERKCGYAKLLLVSHTRTRAAKITAH